MVPAGTWTRSASRSRVSSTGYSWPERTRLSKPGRWRAVDEHGAVLDVLLQEHRDTEAAKTFFTTLLSTYEVPTTIHTDKLGSYGAAIRELPELHGAAHCEVISTARCNNVIEQRPSPIQVLSWPRQSHRTTRDQERSQKGFKNVKQAQQFLDLHASGQASSRALLCPRRTCNLHQYTRTTVTAETRRSNQRAAFQTWNEVALLAA